MNRGARAEGSTITSAGLMAMRGGGQRGMVREGRIRRRLGIIVRWVVATGPMRGRAAARIADSAATTLRGTTGAWLVLRRRTAERVQERSAAGMRTARSPGRTAVEGAKAWVRRVVAAADKAAVAADRVAAVVVAGLRRAVVAAAEVRLREAEDGIDLL
jgi:hypothetical protein